MHIHSIAYGPGSVGRPAPPAPPSPPEKPTDPAPASTTAIAEGAHEPEQARGALRLLEEGHFKGVADVRLRINFADQIDARQTELVMQTVGNHLGSVASVVDENVQSLLDGDEWTDVQQAAIHDAHTGFNDALGATAESLGNGGSTDVDGVTSSLDKAFSQLVIELRGALAPAEAEPDALVSETDATKVPTPSEEPDSPTDQSAETSELVGTVSGSTQVEPTDDPLAKLIMALEAALADLQVAVSETNYLPPISEPSGNGAAYAKFLAIYEAIDQGLGDSADDDTREVLSLDVTA